MKSIKEKKKSKYSFKRTVLPLFLGATMFFSSFVFVGCIAGQDGKDGENGKDGAWWYSGTNGIETVAIGKAGDFYIDTNLRILYQKRTDGTWAIVMTDFGSGSSTPGAPGQDGAPGNDGVDGESAYVYMAFASDALGTDFSLTHEDGLNYIGIISTNQEIVNLTKDNFKDKWIKFVGDKGADGAPGQNGADGENGKDGVDGDDGAPGAPGQDGAPGKDGADGAPGTPGKDGENGQSSYLYIAFASDAFGTDFSLTHQDGLKYIGIIATNEEITNLTKDNFKDKWIKFVGDDGENGKDGVDGDNGTDGTSSLTPYIGYDGYFWVGSERTEHKAVDTYDKVVGDNTLGLIGNSYFSSYTITTGTPIALMNNYFSTLKKTGYSGVAVSKLHVYVENAGTLTISTANVADITSRNTPNGITLNNSVQKTLLNKGLNVITFDKPFVVSSNETLVLGASGDTASLVAYQGISSEEILGSFTDLSKVADAEVTTKTNGVNDKLILKVETADKVTKDFIDGFTDKVMKYSTGWTDVIKTYTPLVYKNKTLFENCTVNYISAMTSSVSAINSNQYITVRLLEIGSSGNWTVKNTYQFKARVSELGTNTSDVSCVINYYPDQPIYVGVGQTLAFYDNNDPVQISFKKGSEMGEAVNESMGSGFYYTSWDNVVNGENISINVNVTKSVGAFFGDNVNNLTEQENSEYVEQTLKNQLSGKYFSILGDSISSFVGYANDTTNNSTIGGNACWDFPGLASMTVNDTWWKQTIDRYGMKLLVNNSWSGSTISNARGLGAWGARCENLHADQGPLNGTTPDVIALYMGINDLWENYPVQTVGANYDYTQFANTNFTPDTFDEAYACAIYKMQKKYPNARIFCFTIPKSAQGDGIGDKLLEYNEAIKNIASHYGLDVIDLYNTVLSDNFTASKYTMDDLHPNAGGMDIMTDAFIEVLKKAYVPNR